MRLQKYLQKYPVSTQNFSYDNRKVTHNINRYKYSKLLPFLIWIYNFFFLIKIWHRKCHEKTATLLISCWIKVPYALLHFTTERYTNKIPNIQIKKTKKKTQNIFIITTSCNASPILIHCPYLSLCLLGLNFYPLPLLLLLLIFHQTLISSQFRSQNLSP